MKYFIIFVAVIILIGVVYGISYTEAFDFTVAVLEDFSDGVNTIKYMFLPNQFKGSVTTSGDLGEYTFQGDTYKVIDYIKRHTNYSNDMTIYANVWTLELKTIVPGQGGEADAIKYDWSYPWLINKNHVSTVFWCPAGIVYYGETYDFVVDSGAMQTLYKTRSDLINNNAGATRFGGVLAIEKVYNIGDYVRNELID